MKRTLVALFAVAACGVPAAIPAEEFLDSVVGVEAAGCSLVASLGSGAILDDQRVVTSAHTVAGSSSIHVIDAEGRSLTATLTAFDPAKDLAVLSVPGLAGDPLSLGRASGGESGWVLAWNRAQGAHANPTTVTKRIRVTIEDIYVDAIVERGAIEIDADVAQGNSGGPVITSSGEVVGIVYATSRARPAGFALNEEEITAAMAGAGDDPVGSGRCP